MEYGVQLKLTKTLDKGSLGESQDESNGVNAYFLSRLKKALYLFI